MMECNIGWEVHLVGWAKADHNTTLTLPINLVVTALLHTGSFVLMMRAHLVPNDRPTLCWTYGRHRGPPSGLQVARDTHDTLVCQPNPYL